jgi:NADH-quinone oxidoreductase subunit G
LNDIASALGVRASLTIDYTAQLPLNAGFKALEFDSLPNYYTNAGEEIRGYLLESQCVTINEDQSVHPFDTQGAMTGTMVYRANPVMQFSPFTARAHQLDEEGGLYLPSEMMSVYGLSTEDTVRVTTSKGEVVVHVSDDSKIKGEIGYLPTFDLKINSGAVLGEYRFSNATIEKV